MKVLLSCYAGMSTSMLIKKMKEHANELECDLEITAFRLEKSTSI